MASSKKLIFNLIYAKIIYPMESTVAKQLFGLLLDVNTKLLFENTFIFLFHLFFYKT